MRERAEAEPEDDLRGFVRRLVTRRIATALATLLLLSGSFGTLASAQNTLMTEAAQSLINRHTALFGGWAWQSVIQAPNFQTDRDVGTASIGTSFLQMYDATGNAGYLTAAEEAGNWLVAVQTSAGWWPDYMNPSNVKPSGPANYGFTSLDDGVIGQAPFLLTLSQSLFTIS
jgi:hypothetical protein